MHTFKKFLQVILQAFGNLISILSIYLNSHLYVTMYASLNENGLVNTSCSSRRVYRNSLECVRIVTVTVIIGGKALMCGLNCTVAGKTPRLTKQQLS